MSMGNTSAIFFRKNNFFLLLKAIKCFNGPLFPGERMNRFIFFFLFLISILSSFEFSNSVLSTPEEVATLSSDEGALIGGLISPFSGQLALRVTDIVARGSQPIVMQRTYVSPYVSPPVLTGNDYKDFHSQINFWTSLKRNYRGWVYLPQICMRVFDDVVRYNDPSGITLDFSLTDGSLHAPPYGLNNTSGDQPSGRFDFRNIRLTKQGNRLSIFNPDGTKREYSYCLVNDEHLYLLEKEILPNGKVLRYDYSSTSISIRSMDPSEKYTYATIRCEGTPVLRTFTANEVDTAVYQCQAPSLREESFKKGKKEKDNSIPTTKNQTIVMPPLMNSISTPSYRDETVGYNSHLQLTNFAGKETHFVLGYKSTAPSRVETLFLLVGENDDLVDLYFISYDLPIAWQKLGKTLASR